MKLNTKGRYAVMAMADIARRGHGKAIPMAQIAERQHISLPYLEQLFSRLRQAGLVMSMRGPGGGYVLARPANRIFVGEVMKAVGEPVKMTRCDRESEEGCINGDDCNTHVLWTALSEHIYSFLDSVSLQDVIDRKVQAFGPITAKLAKSGDGGKAEGGKRDDERAAGRNGENAQG
jgi:iron-sulfur cluster assembly transcription factor IscR